MTHPEGTGLYEKRAKPCMLIDYRIIFPNDL